MKLYQFKWLCSFIGTICSKCTQPKMTMICHQRSMKRVEILASAINNAPAGMLSVEFPVGTFVLVFACALRFLKSQSTPGCQIWNKLAQKKHSDLQPWKQANRSAEIVLDSTRPFWNSSMTRALLELSWTSKLHFKVGDSLEPRSISRRMQNMGWFKIPKQ